MKIATIYYLKDPICNLVRYIGKTDHDLSIRLKNHIDESRRIMNGSKRRKINKRYSWIISLLKNSLIPSIEKIESIQYSDKNEWKERETFWIKYYREIYPDLLNMTNGGDGGDTNSGRKFGSHSIESRKKISEALKRINKTPEKKAQLSKQAYNTLGKILINGKLRPDLVKKISDGTKEWWKNNKEWMTERIIMGSGKPVICYNIYGEFIKEYRTASEANKRDGFSTSVISRVCKGFGETHKGCVWRFKGDDFNKYNKIKNGR